MPELAELKLTADFINDRAKNQIFHSIFKNPNHKGKDIFDKIDFPFMIRARSRGKELMLELSTPPEFAKEKVMQVEHLLMTMGMSGHFKWVEPGVFEKHAHLMFKADGGSLAFVDVRRFGKWKWSYWSPDRGPDPVNANRLFIKNIKENLHKKDFDKPIHEVLMNQKWFNGIGNYLRAEILYRSPVDPFISAREALTQDPNIFELCRELPLRAYLLGGGQLKDWKNPFEKAKKDSWDKFMKCYGNPNMAKIQDKNGRTFWYNPLKQK